MALVSNLLLTSLGLGALPGFLERFAPGGRGIYVPTAAAAERDAPWVAEARGAFAAALRELAEVWLEDDDDPALLAEVDAVILGPGDPFHLLDRLHATGWDAAIASAVRSGVAYVGMSAGSLVAGPSLEPCTVTSPHAPRSDLGLHALRLVDCVVLPHDDRPGRAALHAEARTRFGDAFELVTLRDDQALWVDDGGRRVVAS